MSASRKTLWVVNYDNLNEFLQRAVSVGATGVAIRTDNDVSAAIPAFHERNIEVYGWRWPSAKEDAAMREARKVVALLREGMDGYYVDPEGAPGKPYDWDLRGLGPLAERFCLEIRNAYPEKPFGTTSHYRGKAHHRNLPWAEFFRNSTVLLPQAYWRTDGGVVGHGIPGDNYRQSIAFWMQSGGEQGQIVPMAGELGSVTAAEIRAYAAEAASHQIDELHFYTYEDNVRDSVWAAVAEV
jgi:hypothetical protein